MGVAGLLELGLDEFGVSDGGAKDGEALFCGGQSGVSDPNVGAQRGEVGWELACSIPNSGLARVQLYACVVEQLFG